MIYLTSMKHVMDNTVGSLTPYQKSVVMGSILGDGYLRIVPGRSNAFLEINHSVKQKDYVDWMYKVLQPFCAGLPKAYKSNGTRIGYRFNTRQHVEFTNLYNQFYCNKKKTIPEINIDPVMLAVWYMDDGSRCRDSDIYLNTQQFSVEEQNAMLHMLKRLGLNARLNKDKHYFRIRFLKESIPKLKHLISDHIVPSMKYKLES